MLSNLLLFAIGLVGLYFGAEWLVGGAARIAAGLGVSSFVVGLTLVSFGTSAPELVVSGLASYRGNGSLAIGNVLGSNVANIALILGISALISAIAVHRKLVVRDVPLMIGLAVLVPIFGWSGSISRVEGGILLTIFVAYIAHLAIDARRESALPGLPDQPGAAPETSNLKLDAVVAVIGLLVLAGGAQVLVVSAIDIAIALDVPEVVIGLTLVAFGTSLPELAASVSASRRGDGQIVIGNVVGSNIFNVALVVGIAALVRPLPVSEAVMRVDAPIVIGLSLILLPVLLRTRRVYRWEGGLLCAGYAGFIFWTVL
ncbi:MAG: calcium/sodium antiporter [Gemmatimonadota bacterium]